MGEGAVSGIEEVDLKNVTQGVKEEKREEAELGDRFSLKRILTLAPPGRFCGFSNDASTAVNPMEKVRTGQACALVFSGCVRGS